MAYLKCLRNVSASSIPDGKTVLPTDDISIWLACGGRSETYTTLSQVLADSTCLSALINDNNAVDYLVRSTTWASDVCGDSSAMSYIGLNNYASNTLLGDSTWCSAICNSTYFESVLNVKVPTMTGYTTPSGEASANAEYTGGGVTYRAWYAFDGKPHAQSSWMPAYNLNPAWLQYEFTNAVAVRKADITTYSNRLKDFNIQGSNNGTDFTTIYTGSCPDGGSGVDVKHTFNFINNTAFKYYRLNCLTGGTGAQYFDLSAVQYYGRANV